MQVISVVSGVPINSLKRLVTSSTHPWLSLRKVSMVWGKLVFSSSRWPVLSHLLVDCGAAQQVSLPPALLLLPPRPLTTHQGIGIFGAMGLERDARSATFLEFYKLKKRGVNYVFDSGVFAICSLVKHENIYFS